MNGRWLGLCGAVVMTVSLASCSAKGQELNFGDAPLRLRNALLMTPHL